MPEANKKALQSVADYLEEQQEAILAKWKLKMQENDAKPTRLSVLSHEKFLDHMPVFLNSLAKKFRGKQGSIQESAQKHGKERWENGIDLTQVTGEWSALHEALIEQLSTCATGYTLDPGPLHEIQKIIAQHIHRGIQNSIQTFYDLEKQKAEAQLLDLNDVLEERKKWENDYTQSLRKTSHDLKGNLVAMKIAVSFLKQRQFDDNEVVDLIDDMEMATEGLSQLLNELLELFKLEAGQTEIKSSSFDVSRILRNLCESLQPVAEREGLELRCSKKDPLYVNGDKQKIKRIAQNLLMNALKYTETGWVGINWEKKDEEQWILQVSDTGPGLEDTHASSILTQEEPEGGENHPEADPSRSAQSRSQAQSHGEGIGLLIVRELSQLMNGIIDVDTAPGEGTTFRILLPLDISKD